MERVNFPDRRSRRYWSCPANSAHFPSKVKAANVCAKRIGVPDRQRDKLMRRYWTGSAKVNVSATRVLVNLLGPIKAIKIEIATVVTVAMTTGLS